MTRAVEVEERADPRALRAGLDVGDQLLLGPAPARVAAAGRAHGSTPTVSRRAAASSSSMTPTRPTTSRTWAAHSCRRRASSSRPGSTRSRLRGQLQRARRTAPATATPARAAGPAAASAGRPRRTRRGTPSRPPACAGRGRPAARPPPAARRRTTAAPGGPSAAAPGTGRRGRRRSPSPGPAAPARRDEPLAVGVPLGEEELELEQVAQPHRLVPAVGRVVQQHQLGDRPVDEVVDRAVAVERRDQVLAALDRVDRLLAAVVDGDDALLRPARASTRRTPAGGAQRVAGVRQVALGRGSPAAARAPAAPGRGSAPGRGRRAGPA